MPKTYLSTHFLIGSTDLEDWNLFSDWCKTRRAKQVAEGVPMKERVSKGKLIMSWVKKFNKKVILKGKRKKEDDKEETEQVE